MSRRKLSELNVIDDFMMNELATNEELKEPCFRRILSVLLDRDIGEINVKAQSIIQGLDTDLRGVRLDVEIIETTRNGISIKSEDDTVIQGEKNITGSQIANIYDFEPHLRKDVNFPKHNRYYQAKIDSRYVKKGLDDFEGLHNLYVITITNFDIFGDGLFEYTVCNKILENPDREYKDGLIFKYFNTRGKTGGSEAVKNMLRFIEKSTSENVVDEATKEISEYVNRVKKSPNAEEIYMTMGDKIDFLCRESEEIGEQRGIGIGEQRGIEIGKQQMLNIIKEAAKKAGAEVELEKIISEYSENS